MNHDSNALRQIAAISIILLAAMVTAFLVVWAVIQNAPISPIADTLGGILIGFATHELGVSRGSTISQQSSAQGAQQALISPLTPQPFLREPEGSDHVSQ